MKRKYKPATLLKRAQKRMNSNGAHWIKNEWTGKKKGEVAHCMMGGIGRELLGKDYTHGNDFVRRHPEAQVAVIALAEAISPQKMKSHRRTMELYYSEEEGDAWLAERAANIVMSYNDSTSTRWANVVKKFEKAIEALGG